jgi:hypothetical protein
MAGHVLQLLASPSVAEAAPIRELITRIEARLWWLRARQTRQALRRGSGRPPDSAAHRDVFLEN